VLLLPASSATLLPVVRVSVAADVAGAGDDDGCGAGVGVGVVGVGVGVAARPPLIKHREEDRPLWYVDEYLIYSVEQSHASIELNNRREVNILTYSYEK
jgi:hypothetical protein